MMLMLVGFGAATACGSPLVITSTDSATKAETILFFVLIIFPLCLIVYCF
jgi:predicted MFS family arabinose efflux permease